MPKPLLHFVLLLINSPNIVVGLLVHQPMQKERSPGPFAEVLGDPDRAVKYNNLGGHGPDTGVPEEIRYSPFLKVLSSDGDYNIDMVVVATTPFHPKNTGFNGLHGSLGEFNVHSNTTVSLKFSFEVRETQQPAIMPPFNITFYDLDGPSHNYNAESVLVHNSDYNGYVISTGSTVSVTDDGYNTTFTSTAYGDVCDNPTSVTGLGTVTCPHGVINQRDHAFVLMLGNRSSYQFYFASGDTGDNTGRNFLFGLPATWDKYPEATPTSAPTASPTTSDSVSEFGDPHLKTIRGEKFDIGTPGTYTLIALPGSSDASQPWLHVQAGVEALGPVCTGRLYVTSLHFSGEWLGDLRTLQFTTKIFQEEDANTNATGGIKMAIGDEGTAQDVREFKAMVPAKFVAEASEFHPSKPQRTNQHVTLRLVKLKLGPAVFIVRQILQREKSGYSNSLWFTASGLQKVPSEIGGLLGNDDHSLAASIPQECRGSGELLQVRRYHNRIHASASLGSSSDS